MQFYVYEHWRPDTNVCFYVGKGKDRRAYEMKNGRNQHHKNITNKLTKLGMIVEVKMIANCLTEQEAHIIEINRIEYWNSLNIKLTNQTKGGEGVSSPTPEVRAKMSAAKIGKNLSDKHKQSIGISNTKPKPPRTPEHCAKIAAAHARRRELGLPHGNKGKQHDSNWSKGIPKTEDQKAKISAALTGRTYSEERLAVHKEAMNRPETKAKLSAAASGKSPSAETRSKLSAALVGKSKGPEFSIKMREVARIREEKKKEQFISRMNELKALKS